MTVNKYRLSLAAAALSAITLAHGQSLSRSSFSGSMITSALSKFHNVRAEKPAPKVVAVATKVASPTVVAQPTKPTMVVAAASKTAVTPKLTVNVPNPPSLALLTPTKTAVASAQPASYAPNSLDSNVEDMASGPFVDPSKMTIDEMTSSDVVAAQDSMAKGTRNLRFRWVEEGYFDAGYEKLIGTFSDQILRYGVRYGDDDLHVYVRNSTLDTRGTGLPYPQVVTGLSAGLEARHWFPGDKMYAVASIGDGISGFNKGKTDTRYGMIGYTSWRNDRWFGDLYGELFYVALATDTFFDWRLRSGRIWKLYKDQSYVWGYWVGQFWIAGQSQTGTENRAEFGPGIGYMWRNSISANLELRGGYSFESGIDDGGHKAYWNPTFIIAGGFYKGK